MDFELFDYQITKQGAVRIFWQNRCIMTIRGERGTQLATDLQNAGEEETQYLLQRVTGNFKRGNEKHKKHKH